MAFVTISAPATTLPPATDRPAASTRLRPARTRGEQAVATRSLPRLTLAHLILITLAVFSIFPVYWMFVTAFRSPDDALSLSPLPWPLSLENFAYVIDTIPIVTMITNTFAMALILAVAQLFVAVLAAYAFATFRFPGKKALFLAFIGSWLVPFQVTMIPNYLLVSQLGLLNTISGVIVPNLCSAFAVLLMRQHMQSFPRDLIDASHMDGRSTWATLWLVVVPNLLPALAALGIMLFISAWNEYLWPTLILQNPDALIQVGVRSFLGAEGNNWGAVMAAAGLACLPIFGTYVFLQRYVVDAFIRSGLK